MHYREKKKEEAPKPDMQDQSRSMKSSRIGYEDHHRREEYSEFSRRQRSPSPQPQLQTMPAQMTLPPESMHVQVMEGLPPQPSVGAPQQQVLTSMPVGPAPFQPPVQTQMIALGGNPPVQQLIMQQPQQAPPPPPPPRQELVQIQQVQTQSGPVQVQTIQIQQPAPQVQVQPPGPQIQVHQPPLQVQPQASQVQMQQPGPPVQLQQPGPSVQVQQPGPPIQVQQHGPPVQIQQTGPPIQVQHTGPPMQVQQTGPAMQVQQQGPPMQVQQQGPPVQIQQPGPPVQVQQAGQPVQVQQPGQVPIQQPPPPLQVQQAPQGQPVMMAPGQGQQTQVQLQQNAPPGPFTSLPPMNPSQQVIVSPPPPQNIPSQLHQIQAQPPVVQSPQPLNIPHAQTPPPPPTAQLHLPPPNVQAQPPMSMAPPHMSVASSVSQALPFSHHSTAAMFPPPQVQSVSAVMTSMTPPPSAVITSMAPPPAVITSLAPPQSVITSGGPPPPVITSMAPPHAATPPPGLMPGQVPHEMQHLPTTQYAQPPPNVSMPQPLQTQPPPPPGIPQQFNVPMSMPAPTPTSVVGTTTIIDVSVPPPSQTPGLMPPVNQNQAPPMLSIPQQPSNLPFTQLPPPNMIKQEVNVGFAPPACNPQPVVSQEQFTTVMGEYGPVIVKKEPDMGHFKQEMNSYGTMVNRQNNEKYDPFDKGDKEGEGEYDPAMPTEGDSPGK